MLNIYFKTIFVYHTSRIEVNATGMDIAIFSSLQCVFRFQKFWTKPLIKIKHQFENQAKSAQDSN